MQAIIERERPAYGAEELDLTLFDTETQTTLLPGLSSTMKTYYNLELIERAEPLLVHDQFGLKRPIPQGRGKKAEWRWFAPLAKALTPIVEGVTPDGNSVKINKLESEVYQYGDFTRLTDVLELTALDDIILQVTKGHASQAGLSLDSVVRDVLAGGTQVWYAPKVSGGVQTPVTSRANLDMTSVLTVDLLFRLYAELSAMNVPKINGKYVAIAHPYTMYHIKRDEEWIKAALYAGSTRIFQNETGEIAGFRFVETSEAKITKDATCPSNGSDGRLAVFSTLFLGEGAYGVTEIEGAGLEMLVKPRGTGGPGEPLELTSTVGWKAMRSAVRLVEEYMIRVESLTMQSDVIEAN